MRTPVGILLLLLVLPFAAPGADERERAVELARQGMLDDALSTLERLWRQTPQDPSLAGDLITVLNWAGRHQRAVEVSEDLDTRRLPRYALRALAQSARLADTGEPALVYYQALIARRDSEAGDYAGYALALTDGGRPDHALSVTASARQRFGPTSELAFAAGFAHFGAGRFVHAATYFREALTMEPGYRDAARLMVRALERIGATGAAQRAAREHREALDLAQHLHVANDRNATWVRWGALDQGRDPARRFHDTDIALGRLDALAQAVASSTALPLDLVRIIHFDRLVALRDRVRMAEVVELFDELAADGVAVPYYAREAAADAFLYLEDPERAGDLYRSVIEEAPNHFDARVGLFYALVEQEDFSAARDEIEALLDSLPRYRTSADGRVVQPEYDWLEASITAAMLEAYADRLDVAMERIQTLRRRAPHNGWLSKELSTIYRWRGWARAALEEARIGRTNFPDDTGLALAESSALMEIGEYRKAEEIAETLFDAFPENKELQSFERDIEAFHSPELELYFSRVRSTPANQVEGEESRAYGARIDTAPMLHHSRLFAAADRRTANFPEGRLRHYRLAAGYAYRYRGIDASIAASESTRDIDESGMIAHAGFEIGDHFGLDIDFESVSIETPLRAIAGGIHADRLSLGLGYDAHESRHLGLGFGRMEFTDNNLREFVAFGWAERWYSGPVYRLYTFLDGYASRNSLPDTDYFNPESDRDLDLTVRQRWKTWRRYQRSFHQVLDLAVGRYRQQGFPDGTTWGIRYEHTFERDDEYLLSYGVRRARDFYDGQPEYVDEVFVRYNKIF